MKIFKFNTKISSNGTIQLPFTPSLFDTDVEIIIVPKNRKMKKRAIGKSFVDKWAGFLKDNDADLSKYDYLSEKYR